MNPGYQLAERQGGVVLRTQLHDLGIAPRTLRRRIRDGYWVALPRGALRAPGSPETRELRSRALLLSRPGLVLTGPAAGDFLGPGPWFGFQPDPRVWVADPSGRLRLRGIRCVHHPDVRSREVQGIAVSFSTCLVADLIRFAEPPRARGIAHESLRQRIVTTRHLLDEAAKLKGEPGVRQLLQVIEQVATGSHAESEYRFHQLLTAAGIAGWFANYRVLLPDGRTVYLDVAFPHARLAIEIDGRAAHDTDSAFDADRRRNNLVRLAGWQMLQFTWRALVRHPEEVVAEVRQALAHAAQGGPGQYGDLNSTG